VSWQPQASHGSRDNASLKNTIFCARNRAPKNDTARKQGILKVSDGLQTTKKHVRVSKRALYRECLLQTAQCCIGRNHSEDHEADSRDRYDDVNRRSPYAPFITDTIMIYTHAHLHANCVAEKRGMKDEGWGMGDEGCTFVRHAFFNP
jgi:hypothetical protein